jgi:hypothetical protein
MLRTTQSMVARNQMEVNRERGSKGLQLLDELAAACGGITLSCWPWRMAELKRV